MNTTDAGMPTTRKYGVKLEKHSIVIDHSYINNETIDDALRKRLLIK